MFSLIKEKEPWCKDTKKIAQIGVYATRKSGEANTANSLWGLASEGVYRILTELKYTFDYLDLTDDISAYELVILPDCVHLSDEAADRLNSYVESGGKVIVSAESAVKDGVFQLRDIGVKYCGSAQYAPRYMRIGKEFFSDVPPMDYVTYKKGVDAVALPGTQVVAPVIHPYFNRGYFKFCSHRHTPSDGIVTDYAAVTRKGNITYIANPLFADYAEIRSKIYREIIARLILDLGIKPFVKAELPSFAEVTLRKKDKCVIVHILNYIIEHKSHTLDTIEETIPLFNKTLSVRSDKKPSGVFFAPMMKEMPFTWDGEYVKCVLDAIYGHEIVVIKFG